MLQKVNGGNVLNFHPGTESNRPVAVEEVRMPNLRTTNISAFTWMARLTCNA